MPWIIRNVQGEICGRCTNKPGPGNKLPDGTPEVPEWIEDDTPEVAAFVAAQVAKPVPTLADQIAALPPQELAKVKAVLAR